MHSNGCDRAQNNAEQETTDSRKKSWLQMMPNQPGVINEDP